VSQASRGGLVDGLADPESGLVRHLAIPIDTRDTEFLLDADELKCFVEPQCVFDPVAEPHQDITPTRFAERVAEGPGRLVGHDLE
jgi:hypothetical protein